ncbi:hypothetical protein ACFVR1_11665 [Psychrobacillus sp. NPDC058041]|uniref:hypothetical protein n=1 Tax=Psychrobacillus sp. NPDC058041 TaxID=3346310 RepID=UPI0036D9B794
MYVLFIGVKIQLVRRYNRKDVEVVNKAYSQVFNECIYTGTDIEVETGFITAKGIAFPEFTVETSRQVGLIKDKDQAESVLRFCRGQSN